MQYVSLYRKIFKTAAKATWQHKGLWFFGFLAGLAQTGAMSNTILRIAPAFTPERLNWQALETTWNSWSAGRSFFALLATATPLRAATSIVVMVVAILLAVLVVAASQHVVLHGVHRVSRRKKHLSWRGLGAAVRSVHVGRILSIDIGSRLLMLLGALLTGWLLRETVIAAPQVQVIATAAATLTVLLIAFFVNAVAMFSLVAVVRGESTLADAIQHAGTFLSRHWLIAVELAALLFLVNLVATALLGGALYLLAQLLVSLLAATTTLPWAFFGVVILTVGVVLVMLFMVGGLLTVFNYSAWTECVERLEKTPLQARLEHLVHRLIHV